MIKSLIISGCFLWCSIARAQTVSADLYKASTIPDSLKVNANSVVRYDEASFNVKGPGRETIKVHEIITILNEKANDEAKLRMNYSRKYVDYSSIDMRIYDANGVSIKKYHKSDMYDGSAADDETMVTDERFLAIRHSISNYPTTVEIEYEEDVNSFISLGGWNIQGRFEQSVQNAVCIVKIDSSMGFRYKAEHTKIQPEKTASNGLETYTWKVQNLPAIKKEERVLYWNVIPQITFAVNTFNYYGYPGDFTSWQSYGKWVQSLNADVSSLTPQRILEMQKMTAGIKTDKEKAQFLYNYMQKNMRYVGIQLGIGGYKPFAASFVDEKKYGDCKALANYMRALLKAVNINSYYTIVRAGVNEKPVDASFPDDNFNHVILCIPFKNDTTWLECTSSTQPFGKLGPFTENRNALLITENGGKLINTPRSTMRDNQFNSDVHIILNADGGAKVELKIDGSGQYRDKYLGIEALKVDEQKQMFMRELNLKQPNVFDLKPSSDKDGVKEVKINLEYDKFCDVMADNKQFYRPHVLDLWAFTIPINENRKNDYYFDTPLQKSCVTTIDLPAGFEIETIPASQTLKFTYGNYEVNYVYDVAKNQLISIAKFNLTNQIIPAAKYTEFQQYLDAVAKAQNKKLVIKRKA